MTEEWKQIPGYGGHYEASTLGRIRVKDRVVVKKNPRTGLICNFKYKGRMLNPHKSSTGYLTVHIGFDGKKIIVAVHRLVLEAFDGACPDGMEGCHSNGDSLDNRPENLRWDTHLRNNRDRLKHGTYSRGERHPMAKISDETAREILLSGKNYREVSAEYGISKTHAHKLMRGESWKHLHEELKRNSAQ
jgi:hypothetical protein